MDRILWVGGESGFGAWRGQEDLWFRPLDPILSILSKTPPAPVLLSNPRSPK